MADPYWRARIQGTLPGGEVWSVNPTFGRLVAPGGGTLEEAEAWAEAILGLEGGLVLPNDIRGALSSSGYITGVRTEFYDGTGGLTFAAEASIPSGVSGGSTANCPSTTAIVASLMTGRVGRSYRGRIFWPALRVLWDEPAHRVAATQATAIAAQTSELLLDVADAYPGASEMRPVVYSARLGVATEITAVRVGNIPDNLRGRKDALDESYVSAAV